MHPLRTTFVVAVMATLAGCGENPAGVQETDTPLTTELVITQGVAAPVHTTKLRPQHSNLSASANLGGPSVTVVSLKPVPCDAGQTIKIIYTVDQPQAAAESFRVNTVWAYIGTSWTGSSPVTVNVAARPNRGSPPPADKYEVTLTVIDSSTTDAGTSSFAVVPFGGTSNGNPGLNIGGGSATVPVAFYACAVINTPPTLVVPADDTVEATSSAGAVVNYVVTANDLEDGDLTGSVTCAPPSGTTFSLGTTTVNCHVTDSGGLRTDTSFTVTVEDTTPAYFTSFPSGLVTLVAANISGAVLDISSLGITVEDWNNVSEPSTFDCDYVTGTALAIGSTTTVDCTASDAIGNTSEISSFDVFVTLNVSGSGFLTPLRMAAPYSAHKRGSTIPHKFVPPTYADGTPALDLASGLTLVMAQLSGTPGLETIEANDFGTGSSAWFLDDDGHYHFNVKTGKTSPWNEGTWQTTVSYAGIVLATTQLSLVR